MGWMTAQLVFYQVLGYLIGGIPFGYLVAKRVRGIDIRDHGSGNIGATNVGRVLGGRWFVVVFMLDFLKGALPVGAALWLRATYGGVGAAMAPVVQFLPEVVGFAAILGHVFPIYLGLRGGKGVATSLGVVALLAPGPMIVALIAFLLLVAASRMVSVGSIGFAFFFVISHYMMDDDPFSFQRLGLNVFVVAIGFLIVIRHAANIGRIINGTESTIELPWGHKS